MSTATATDPNTLLMADAGTQDPRPEPPRDRWGRYLIPHPTTGEPQAWTRATTFAKTCADTFGLEKWGLRMALLGVARRPDILARIASITDPDDRDQKKLLDQLAQQAKDIAGTSAGSNLGSALHSFTESIDLGRPVTVPPPWDADVAAYRNALADGGVIVDPAHVERIVTVPELELAGTFDRLVTLPDGRRVVADLKTGKELSYSWGEIAIQLALYAHADTIYDVATGKHQPMPEVDRTQALVMHLPVGKATCTLWLVDIAAGWDMAQVCKTVRTWRKRKNLAAPYTAVAGTLQQAGEAKQVWLQDPNTSDGDLVEVVELNRQLPAVVAGDDRVRWIVERLGNLRAADQPRKQFVARQWPTDCPTKPPWTNPQIDVIDQILNQVETAWPDRDPAAPPLPPLTLGTAGPAPVPTVRRPDWTGSDDGETVGSAVVAALQQAVAALDDAHKLVLARWAREGREQGRRWTGTGGTMTFRDVAISAAALACVEHLWDVDEPDDLTRAAIAHAAGGALEASWWTGAVLGSLTAAQAEALRDLVVAYGRNDHDAGLAIGAAQVAAN